jgi:predicted regulator of Ras-like GTPase activity (Roadblock/LC7/MglB family)
MLIEMSAFGDILKSIVERVPGALGAIFADWEGEMVDQFAHIPPMEIQLVGAHWGVVLNQASRVLMPSGVGAIQEFLVEGERGMVLIRCVTDRYYVVLTGKSEVHLATARRELERGAATLLGEM